MYEEGEPLSTLEKPTATEDEHTLTRPPPAEVEPYGVQWYGAAEHRKDWMTTLTGLRDLLLAYLPVGVLVSFDEGVSQVIVYAPHRGRRTLDV